MEFCFDFDSFFETNVLGIVLISIFTLESTVVACNPASALSDFVYITNKRPRSANDTNILGIYKIYFILIINVYYFAYLLFNSLQISVNAR